MIQRCREHVDLGDILFFSFMVTVDQSLVRRQSGDRGGASTRDDITGRVDKPIPYLARIGLAV